MGNRILCESRHQPEILSRCGNSNWLRQSGAPNNNIHTWTNIKLRSRPRLRDLAFQCCFCPQTCSPSPFDTGPDGLTGARQRGAKVKAVGRSRNKRVRNKLVAADVWDRGGNWSSRKIHTRRCDRHRLRSRGWETGRARLQIQTSLVRGANSLVVMQASL